MDFEDDMNEAETGVYTQHRNLIGFGAANCEWIRSDGRRSSGFCLLKFVIRRGTPIAQSELGLRAERVQVLDIEPYADNEGIRLEPDDDAPASVDRAHNSRYGYYSKKYRKNHTTTCRGPLDYLTKDPPVVARGIPFYTSRNDAKSIIKWAGIMDSIRPGPQLPQASKLPPPSGPTMWDHIKDGFAGLNRSK